VSTLRTKEEQQLSSASLATTSKKKVEGAANKWTGGTAAKQTCTDVAAPLDTTQLKSLNLDPYNLQSEELALAECMQGFDVRRIWSEQELVRSFGGQQSPGTPDGMFEKWDGVLTCVQVVRVPLVLGMSPAIMEHVLAQTVLCKVVKSQQWLRSVHASPNEFIIFCWLPFPVASSIADYADTLMHRVQQLDWRFSLRLRVPALPGALFPTQFATTKRSEAKARSVSESEVSRYSGEETESSDDDDELCNWDITWTWEDEGDPGPS
jgi:hypothetical protein